ncbi:unnamed protein product [Mytilus coruscus]|uniref:Uncharacterized protein n=1 Tax=Mytilus coruscus TaxID=42192 RepID=A0A6J8D8K8_MYTCO|nr:unnamed protein product [Mytilus coruscus]
MEFLPLIDEVLDAMQNIIQFDNMHFPCGLCEHNTDIKSEVIALYEWNTLNTAPVDREFVTLYHTLLHCDVFTSKLTLHFKDTTTVLACYLLAEKLNSKNSVHGILIMVIADGILTQRTCNMCQIKLYMVMTPVKRSLKKQSLSYLNLIVLQHTCSKDVYYVLTCLSTIWEGAHVDVDVDVDVNIKDADVTKADVTIGLVYKGDVAKADVSIDVDVHVTIYEKVPVNTMDEESCDGLSIYKI